MVNDFVVSQLGENINIKNHVKSIHRNYTVGNRALILPDLVAVYDELLTNTNYDSVLHSYSLHEDINIEEAHKRIEHLFISLLKYRLGSLSAKESIFVKKTLERLSKIVETRVNKDVSELKYLVSPKLPR